MRAVRRSRRFRRHRRTVSTVGGEPVALVTLGLRADFYGHCASYPELAGLGAGDGLPGVGANRYEPGVLPLLAHALFATWQYRHTDSVPGVAFEANRNIVATASSDRTARLWDMTDPRKPGPLATLTGHTDGIRSVGFSPDGRTLATGSLADASPTADRTTPSSISASMTRTSTTTAGIPGCSFDSGGNHRLSGRPGPPGRPRLDVGTCGSTGAGRGPAARRQLVRDGHTECTIP